MDHIKDIFYALSSCFCGNGKLIDQIRRMEVECKAAPEVVTDEIRIADVRSSLELSDATLKLNGRSFKILKLLGEGGFSYVRFTLSLPHQFVARHWS